MDNNIKKYRTKHPNCKWCKYYKYQSRCYGEFHWEECILKDKYIKYKNIKAKLCNYYILKESKDEI